MNDMFDHIERHRGPHVDRLLDYVARPSISASGEGLADVAEYIGTLMREIGLDVRLLPTPGAPMVYGELCQVPGRPTVLLYGHYDVQPPDPLDEWVSPPFDPEIRDGRIYARGVGDNKGQHLAQLLALKTLLECRGGLPCNVKVLLEGEEEIGSPHIAPFVDQHRDLLRADLVVISDGPVDGSGRPRISFGVRGVLNFELRASGANSDLHSGHWGGVAPEPMWTLVHLLATMKDRDGRITVEGIYDRVEPLTSVEREVLARLPIDVGAVERRLGVDQLAEPIDRGVGERITAWPTLTINGFHGGYGGPGSKTVLPREAVAKCDVRLVEAQTVDDVFAKIESHVRRHAPQVRVIRGGGMEPSKTRLDSPYVPPLRRAIVAAQGEEPILWPAGGGSLPLYPFTRTLGVPTFGVPYGSPDQANHAPNENMEVERFIKGIKTGVAIVAELGEL